MNKLWLAIFLLLASSIADGRTLVVDPSGVGDSKTINGAIIAASPGDLILVRPGDYISTVDLKTRLEIEGEGQVSIKSLGQSAFKVNADGCRISNISFIGSAGEPAIALLSGGNVVFGCTFKDGSVGVRDYGSNNTIQGCQARSSAGIEFVRAARSRSYDNVFYSPVGVRILNATACLVDGCTFLGIGGIELREARSNLLEDNVFQCQRFGIAMIWSSENIIAANRVLGCTSGLDLTDSRSNKVTTNNLSGCKIGIRLARSELNRVDENSCTGSEREAIRLENSSQNVLTNNNLSSSTYGLLAIKSSQNRIDGTQAEENTYGMVLQGRGENTLRNNSLFSNVYNLKVDAGETSEESGRILPFVQDIDSSNTADGKPVYYLVEESDRILKGDCGFLGLVSCKNISASNMTIANSSTGTLLVGSTECKVENSTLLRCERGALMIESQGCIIEGSAAEDCQVGFFMEGSNKGLFSRSSAKNCSVSGFKLTKALEPVLSTLSASGGRDGIVIMNSKLGMVKGCNASNNLEAGMILSNSHKFTLEDNLISFNDRGISMAGSNSCSVLNNAALGNERDGIALEQLSDAKVSGNTAKENGQGIFIQSSKGLNLKDNNASNNTLYGLKMSSSIGCNITNNIFIGNVLAGVNLVDCSDNYLYHNIFSDNGYQNALDNSQKNHWDAGPMLGGNYWSDQAGNSNPGNVHREIPSKGIDRYPFKDPKAW
jgi:parallel beta-helix repeat protein